MAQLNKASNGKTLTHIYVRDSQKSFVRPCWSAGAEVYCGICVEGKVQPVVGAVCPVCSGTVERILEVSYAESGSAVLVDVLESRRAHA